MSPRDQCPWTFIPRMPWNPCISILWNKCPRTLGMDFKPSIGFSRGECPTIYIQRAFISGYIELMQLWQDSKSCQFEWSDAKIIDNHGVISVGFRRYYCHEFESNMQLFHKAFFVCNLQVGYWNV